MNEQILYRKVDCGRRKPKAHTPVIAIFKDGTVAKVTIAENGYWWLYEDDTDCDEPECWLEPVQLPTDDEIENISNHYKNTESYGSEDYEGGLEDGCKYGIKKCIELLTKTNKQQ